MPNPNPNYLTYPVIQSGSTGPDVKFAQKQLQVYLPSESTGMVIDGSFGPKTTEVMKAFQRKCGISADGIAGGGTWPRLGPQVNSVLIEHYAGYKKRSIEEVQRLLKLGARYTGTVDGLWGPNTENAVKSFQRAYGLTDDGIWGRQCWAIVEQGYI